MTSAIAFVVLLGVLVTVHELGHFLVAKACGVRVLTFSIGFGPRLFGFRRGDTDYRVSLIPLGGYVRMYGDDVTEEIPESERARSFLHKPYLQKSAIAIAGPAANLLLPILLFAGLFFGTDQVNDAVVGTVFPGEPAAEAGLQAGDRIVAVEGKPTALFEDVQRLVEARPAAPTRLTLERGGVRSDVIVTPKAVPTGNPIAPQERAGRIGITPQVELPIVAVVEGSPAHAAGVRSLDRVTHVDGVAVPTREALAAALRAVEGKPASLTVVTPAAAGAAGQEPTEEPQAKTRTVVVAPAAGPALAPASSEVLRFAVTEDEVDAALAARIEATRRAAHSVLAEAAGSRGLLPVDGVVVVVEEGTAAHERGIARGDQIVALDAAPLGFASRLEMVLRADPDGIHTVGVRSGDTVKVLAFRMAESKRREMGGMKVFGVVAARALGEGALVERTTGPIAALGKGLDQTVRLTRDTIRGLAGVFTAGSAGLAQLSGPITIFDLAGKAAERGAPTFFNFMAFISVSLAVFNLLPVPVLDGGHLLMFSIEAVKGKALSLRTRERAAQLGLVLVLVLMVVALHNDIAAFFTGA